MRKYDLFRFVHDMDGNKSTNYRFNSLYLLPSKILNTLDENDALIQTRSGVTLVVRLRAISNVKTTQCYIPFLLSVNFPNSENAHNDIGTIQMMSEWKFIDSIRGLLAYLLN